MPGEKRAAGKSREAAPALGEGVAALGGGHFPLNATDGASIERHGVSVFETEKDVPMPVMQPPKGSIEISDPNNVPELFVNGPFNIMNMGGMVQITLTTMRPNANDLFNGNDAPAFRGTVTCRLLMPAGLAEKLVRTVADALIEGAQSSQPAAPTQASGNSATSRHRPI
jgi:hypothetical protein